MFNEMKREQLIYFVIDCKQARLFTDCIVKRENEVWLNRFYVPTASLKCFRNQKISKQKIFY